MERNGHHLPDAQLRHYLERGVSKAALARRFGMSRWTIHEWIQTGQLDRDMSTGGSRYSPRSPAAHKLDPYKAIIDSRLEQFPGLSAQRLYDEVRATDYLPSPLLRPDLIRVRVRAQPKFR